MAVIERANVIAGASKRPFVKAGAPGGTDFDGEADKGDLCIDSTNGKLYVNTGTKASPTWTVVGTQT